MTNLLKNFPATNPNALKNVIVKEIKSEVSNIKSDTVKIQDDGLKLLAELLRFFREKKEMSTLMLCTKIEKIIVDNSVANIYFENYNKEVENNENFRLELKKFFDNKHLGFKVIEKDDELADQKLLNKLLDGKLKIV